MVFIQDTVYLDDKRDLKNKNIFLSIHLIIRNRISV